MKVENIQLGKILQTENSRVIYKKEDLQELMASMKKNGLFHPIGVMKVTVPGKGKKKVSKYEAVFGNRRLQAANKLGWLDIPAHVMDVKNDVDRDFINLMENIKRRNTSVAEDGRMFLSLMDRGLSEGEIAARLDISKQRVETAVEVYRDVPEQFRKDIINAKGGKKPSGKITAATAHEVLNLRRNFHLNRKQTTTLLEYAKKDESSAAHMRMMAPLVRSGLTVEKALVAVEKFQLVEVRIYMSRDEINRIEKKHGKSVTTVLGEHLEADGTFKVRAKPVQDGRYKPNRKISA
jgi:ParB/RepB/Spo0J family partition protein